MNRLRKHDCKTVVTLVNGDQYFAWREQDAWSVDSVFFPVLWRLLWRTHGGKKDCTNHHEMLRDLYTSLKTELVSTTLHIP